MNAAENAKNEILTQHKSAKINCFELDLADNRSISNFVQNIKKCGKIDVLINNAGFAYKRNCTLDDYKQAVDTFDINYFGTKTLTNQLADNITSRIITVSSMCSDSSFRACSRDMQSKILDKNNLSEEKVDR